MIEMTGLLATGLIAGILAGLFGVGGGIIIIPALIFIFGLTQHQAQGTTLALFVPPIGILAAWTYYKAGYVDLKVAALICAGFVFGALMGAEMAKHVSDVVLKRAFAVIMIITAVRMMFEK
jgi:uncharacterized protein